jgi:hypothetical protein
MLGRGGVLLNLRASSSHLNLAVGPHLVCRKILLVSTREIEKLIVVLILPSFQVLVCVSIFIEHGKTPPIANAMLPRTEVPSTFPGLLPKRHTNATLQTQLVIFLNAALKQSNKISCLLLIFTSLHKTFQRQ